MVATELGGEEVGLRFHVNKLWSGLFTEQISKHWLPLDRDPLPTNPREKRGHGNADWDLTLSILAFPTNSVTLSTKISHSNICPVAKAVWEPFRHLPAAVCLGPDC